MIASDRESKLYSEKVFRMLFKNSVVRKYCINILSKSISVAHNLSPSCWSVTLFPKKIRLNVGPVETLVFRPEKIFIVTSDMSDEIDLGVYKSIIDPPGIYYTSVDILHQLCYLSSENILKIYPSIENFHHYFIQIAATKRKRTSWYKSFSPDIIRYINEVNQKYTPFPSYSNEYKEIFLQPEEIPFHNEFCEGALTTVTVNSYERNNQAREACIKIWGCYCQCCGMNFEDEYGEIGKNFIHIHHKNPLSDINAKYQVQPDTDLIPVCPNCHSMLHKRIPPYTTGELIQIRKRNKL
jgi:5-methylcytosine-specific restriction protein A